MKLRSSGRRLLARYAAGVMLLAVVTAVGGCTGHGRSDAAPTTGPSAPSPGEGSGLPVPSTNVITAASRLGCDDGTTAINPPDPSLPRANGLTADGWANDLLPMPSTTAAGQISFWKAFLYATKDAQRWTTVTVDRHAAARLYYVPFVAWSTDTTSAKLDMSRLAYGRSAIAFESCGQEPRGYPGGVLTEGPACVTLTVSADGRPDARIRLAPGMPCS